MPTYSLEQSRPSTSAHAPAWRAGLLAALAWIALGLFTELYPDGGKPWPYTRELAVATGRAHV